MKFSFPSAILILFSLIIIVVSCKRINEATSIGGNVIPPIDGVTTFDTTMEVEAFNMLFASNEDSFYSVRSDGHLIGTISGDPLFGKTYAKMFIQLKPFFYKWTFSNITNPDSLHLDSVVLVLGWQGTYGDTNTMQRFRVYEMDQANKFTIDSNYLIREQSFTYSSFLGQKDFYPYQLKDSVKVFRDTTANQLRIRLSNAFGNRLLKSYDTTNAYASDSAFVSKLKGFAIESDAAFGGNALMAFGVQNEPNTKLAIYYRYTKNGSQDTTVSYFNVTSVSANHNYIQRDYTGSPYLASLGGTTPDNLIYLNNVPGGYARVNIPGLGNLSNRIVHRAELIMQQVYDPSDKTFVLPNALFLDMYDSTISKYKVVPYDFIADASGVAFERFGLYGKNSVDNSGNLVREWRFDLSRYVQNILTKKINPHPIRLITHRFLVEQIRTSNIDNTGAFAPYGIELNKLSGIGRVRLGGGNHPTQKMRLRIIYSKL